MDRILRRNYLLNLTLVSILGVVVFFFFFTSEGIHEIYSAINKERIKTVLKRRSVFFTFLCACLALHTEVLSGETAGLLRGNIFSLCVSV